MKSYSFVKMFVDGKETATLDIYKEHNVFHVFEYDENVYDGDYTGVMIFIDNWKQKHQPLVDYIKSKGEEVHYEQSIK